MRRAVPYILFIMLLVSGCTDSGGSSIELISESEAENSEVNIVSSVNANEVSTGSNKAIINEIQYSFNILSALDYLKGKGERPLPQHVEGLKKESVVIFEINSLEKIKDIYASEKIQMNKEDAIKYLMGSISTDITLVQDNKEFNTTGTQFDGMLTGANTFRLFLFYKNVNVEKPITLKFYDRLFGAGMINLKHHEINSI